ncbi:MAG: hypothetical protein R6X02_00700 [Enhygromyxa sp.]
MAGKISSFPSGVQSHESSRGASFISTNSRVRTTRGRVGLVTDVVLFPGATGVWFMPNQRVRVNNIPTIGSSSVGISTNTQSGVFGTMQVVEGEGRNDAM